MIDPYQPEGLAALLDGEPAYRARQVRAWLARGVDDPASMTDLPRSLRERLGGALMAPPRILRMLEADGGLTRKLLLGTADSEAVESVLMLYPRGASRSGRATVCVSTQAGCAMGCPFCATGQVGFRRQLTVGEIVRQVTVIQRLLRDGMVTGPQQELGRRASTLSMRRGPQQELGRRASTLSTRRGSDVPDHVTNVVFMGMGEPLANLEPTIAAIRWLHQVFELSARAITVSTIGLVPGIRRLMGLRLPITLAISLHAPDDALRDDLVPPNRHHGLAALMGVCEEWVATTGRRLTFEYVLIDGVNASLAQAEALARLVAPLRQAGGAHLNLIPMNPTPAVGWHAPPMATQRAFASVLERHGVAVTIRHNRGVEIDAACGQLYANHALGSGRTLPNATGAADRIAGRG